MPLPDPAASLPAEQQALQDFLAVLQREQAQLVAADIDGLTQVTAEKNALVGQISKLAQGRYAALAAAAHDADERGMRAWLEQGREQESRRAAHRLWTGLMAQAEAARELNRTNGLLIGKQLARHQAALNVLHGASRGASLYGPDGQTKVAGSSHRLIAG